MNAVRCCARKRSTSRTCLSMLAIRGRSAPVSCHLLLRYIDLPLQLTLLDRRLLHALCEHLLMLRGQGDVLRMIEEEAGRTEGVAISAALFMPPTAPIPIMSFLPMLECVFSIICIFTPIPPPEEQDIVEEAVELFIGMSCRRSSSPPSSSRWVPPALRFCSG
jgi:hypothetical protein